MRALLLATILALAFPKASKGNAQDLPVYPSCGVLYNYDEDALIRLGYTKCYDEPYSSATSEYDLQACAALGRRNVFVGAKNLSSSTQFYIGAFGNPSNVFSQTDSRTTAIQGPGGAYWYNVPSASFGFANTSAVNLQSCDYGQSTGNCESRLCWHLGSGGGGFRAGCVDFLNSNGDWRKIIYLGNQTYSCQQELPSIAVDVIPQQALIYEGTTNLTLGCAVNMVAREFIEVKWYKDDVIFETGGNAEITSLNLTGLDSVHTYISNITFRIATLYDTGVYVCNVTYSVNNTYVQHLVGEASVEIEVAPLTVSLTLSSIIPRGGIGLDIYNLSCVAVTPQGLALYKEFVWSLIGVRGAPINVTFSSVDSNSLYMPISYSVYETSLFSVTSVTASCSVKVFYGEGIDEQTNEFNSTVNLPGPSAPTPVENVTVKYSFELAIISWVVPYTAYTPETYIVRYSTSLSYLNSTGGSVLGSLFFSSSEETYSITVRGLSTNTTYYYTIISSNSYGTVMSSIYSFTTLTNDIYQVENYTTIPIGAFLELQFNLMIAFRDEPFFIALDHSTIQVPTITTDYSGTVNVTFGSATFSLNGSYILCIGDTCGSKISINVTVPTLRVSSNILVGLISDVENGNWPSVTCIPSDLRAPVKWNVLDGITVTYFPDGLFHTIAFLSSLPQTFVVTCDLVDVENEQATFDPQGVVVRFISRPVVILNNDTELYQDPIINYFTFSGIHQLNLTCLSIEQNGNLTWVASNARGQLNQIITVNNQNVTLVVRDVSTPHYFSCGSQNSTNSAYVRTTLLSPVWKLVSVRNSSLPVGAVFDIRCQYADASNGSFNLGPGFYVEVYFTPFDMSAGYELLDSRDTDPSANYFDYNTTSTTAAGGLYTVNATHMGTGEVFSDVIELNTFVPEFVGMQSDVYALVDSNVTLNCTPSDDRTPVFWSLNYGEGSSDLTNNPDYFTFSPPYLNHIVTFEVYNVIWYLTSSPIRFSCYLYDHEQSQYINVIVQNERIELHDPYTSQQIINNSVINFFPIKSPIDGTGQTKRSFGRLTFAQVECTAVIGDEDPIWLSDNALITDSTGEIVSNDTFGISVYPTPYSSQLDFGLLGITSYAGKYICQSRQSGLSANFLVTSENPFLKFEHLPVVTALLGDRVNLNFKVAYDSTGMDDFSSTAGNITLEFIPFSNNSTVNFNGIASTIITVNNYYFALGEVNSSYAGVYTVTYDSSSFLFPTISDNITLQIIEPELITSHSSITLLVGDSVDLSCHTSEGSYELYWILYTPYSMNTNPGAIGNTITLSISSATISNSGKYGCVLTSAGTTLQRNITVQVLNACPRGVYGGILWEKTAENAVLTKPCSEAGAYFRRGPVVSRNCLKGGSWANADFTSCTLTKTAVPFALVWMVTNGTIGAAQNDQVPLENKVKELLNQYNVPYSTVMLQSVYVSSVGLTFQIIPLTTNSTFITTFGSFASDLISSQEILHYSITQNSGGYIAINPSDSCPCASNTNANSNSFLSLCNSASVSPCFCSPDSCQCIDPFVGDGLRCTLDTDGDGYPDVILNSCTSEDQSTYCQADNCPSVYNPTQDLNACVSNLTAIDQTFKGCPFGTDPTWGVAWANTLPGAIDTERCPGGVDSFGMATRLCKLNGDWAEPVVSLCSSLTFRIIFEQTQYRLGAMGTSYNQLLIDGEIIQQELVNATSPNISNIPLLPLDLNTTNSVVASLIQALMFGLENNITQFSSLGLIDVFNNILDAKNLNGWIQLQTVDSGSQSCLYNAEQYASYLAQASDSPVSIGRSNIVMSTKKLMKDSVTDVIFPINDDLENSSFASILLAKIIVPKELILERISTFNQGNSPATIANIIFNNMNSFLPTNSPQLRPSSLVISSQVYTNDLRISSALQKRPVTITFTLPQADVSLTPLCVFWNFTSMLKNGSWSNYGVSTSNILKNNAFVTVNCTSTHLTSFAVLVDVAGGLKDASRKEVAALNIVSYIGCAVSIASLIATVIFFLYQGKKLLSSVHQFVHLNLCISLLLAYTIFVIGIETGRGSTGGCALVAALLQYLFLASFSWMLCEGIMLYLMLVVVFSTLAKKWWAFLIIGYGLPIPFVVIGLASRHTAYGVQDVNGTLQYCWLSTTYGTIWAFVAPMIVTILINCVFFALALHAIAKSRKKQASVQGKNWKLAISLLKSSLVLLPLLGLTWVFGLLTINKYSTALAWIFTILNSLQGVAIFFFHVIRNDKVWSKTQSAFNCLKKATSKTDTYEVSNAAQSKKGKETIAIKMSTYKDSSGMESGSSEAPLEVKPEQIQSNFSFTNEAALKLENEKEVGSTNAELPK